MGKGKKSKYVHGGAKALGNAEKEHKRAMKTHESEERRMQLVRKMKVNQLKAHMEKQFKRMSSYIPDHIRERMKKPIDPAYNLKGAARVAREHYKAPGDNSVAGDEEARNLIEEFKGNVWAAPDREGEILLEKMILYAACLHNVTNETNHAVKVFYDVLEHDPTDHLAAKQRILRCYMDAADAVKARALIDRFKEDRSCCFMYNKALIEFISYKLLQEKGSSQELCDAALEEAYKANPYALFALAYNSVFADTIEYAALIRQAPEGSVEDAISFFDSDMELWDDVEGAIDWVREWMTSNNVPPPLMEELPAGATASASSASSGEDTKQDDEEKDDEEQQQQEEEEEEEEEDVEMEKEPAWESALGDPTFNPLYNPEIAALSEEERHAMYTGMVRTALEMAEVI